MNEGRALVYPQAIVFGARCLTVPGRGNVLCASATVPFSLHDARVIEPAQWYEALRACAGTAAIPDAMAPLPGAEVLVLGGIEVDELRREATLRCGSVNLALILRPDPDAPGEPLEAGPEAALWHEEDNPDGRGGPDDDRRPLIMDAVRPRRPLWLGPTPMRHPVRLRRVGVPDAQSGTGWPKDAKPSVLHDTHEAFWAKALNPGDPLVLTGLSSDEVDIDLPPYRVAMVSARTPDGEWLGEEVRIHSVTLVPRAGVGAVIWRAGIDLGEDIMGQSVIALVAALEDANAAARDPLELALIAVDRWENPALTLDDRPLLPPDLAATVAPPLALPPEGDPHALRQSAAQDWAQEEAGVDFNPFDAPPGDKDFAQQMTEVASEGGPTDVDKLGEIADAALQQSKDMHEKMGLGDVAPPSPRPPVARGGDLAEEVRRRLAKPYQTQHEVAIADSVRMKPDSDLDAGEILGRLNDARIGSPEAPLFWPALPAEEAAVFGGELLERLRGARLPRHIDVSGAIVDGGADAETESLDAGGDSRLEGLRIEGLLAEETVWRGLVFDGCTLADSSFASARFESCEFRNTVFEGVNFNDARCDDCRFHGCEITAAQAAELTWMNCLFDDCAFERCTLTAMAMRDVIFRDGSWRNVQMDQGVLVSVSFYGTALEDVTFLMTHAPHMRFEGVSMLKVSATSKGFPGSVFKDVDARNCLFGDTCHFDEASFETVRFVDSGFTNAAFVETRFASDCRFANCDFTGAVFATAVLAGCRFRGCTLSTTIWGGGSDARDAWFFGSILRGVNFNDTLLARAVFADADLSGAVFDDDQVVGADFTGTVCDQ